MKLRRHSVEVNLLHSNDHIVLHPGRPVNTPERPLAKESNVAIAFRIHFLIY
eukprot:XP_001709000.1 Hypothetical protein GL50803_38900 [Giardia lamblia ATCC 50803]